MIFLFKKGRFGNYLFQMYLAKIIRKKTNQKIVVFKKNENKFKFNNKLDIDLLLQKKNIFPRYEKLKKILGKFSFEVNDTNFLEVINNNNSEKNYLLDGFFQNYKIVENFPEILDDILLNKNLYIKQFKKSDLTIHIRHMHNELEYDYMPLQKENVPNKDFYLDFINKFKPQSIKIICSTKENIIVKDILKNCKNAFFEGKDDISDFFNLIDSEVLLSSISTYSWWASIFSKAKEIYMPNDGLFSNFENNRNFFIQNKRFHYISIN